MENLKWFDEFLERRFPESPRKTYYLMSIHEHLPPHIRKELKQVGWAKAAKLTEVARSDGKDFERATWLHKARAFVWLVSIQSAGLVSPGRRSPPEFHSRSGRR